MLGNDLIHIQSLEKPSAVLFAFDHILEQGLIKVQWAVAYATKTGCIDLVESIINSVGESAWAECEKEFVISIDFGHTEPGALEFLKSLNNSSVFIANHHLIEKGHLRPTSAYHPKLYCFHYESKIGIISGSANLTRAALSRNTEIVQSSFFNNSDLNIDCLWQNSNVGTTPLTDELLEKYKELRKQAKGIEFKRAASSKDLNEDTLYTPDSTEMPISSDEESEAPWLWGEISRADNAFNPLDYEHFWIEAGSMSSSASHHQLELARGSNLFFGYAYQNFNSDGGAVILGNIKIKIKNVLYSDDNRKYKWHPNNMMERVNLPTYKMCGVDYKHKCLLFKRHEDYFELKVADWNSEVALAWRAASSKLNTRFRIPQRVQRSVESRVCGFF
ncbi:TPA: hypothetical protein ACN32Y_004016 [Vibrio parahaemolyticus]|uniref:hypothetical protein n=1 Tax=Vibrio parahaemolyticus TaxID=670 RepID=UPI000A3ABCB3|nr:hypothetical protein [Vibrio parahaemolyticus]MBM4936374.1 hypothetical protein [Vibrio parahaemolyticus]OUJ41032.1 hypothetical protein BTZ53_21290 [Vibrio parahaemolyticus]HAS8370657.1 hypothetical protein [Vibrio vulnificus]